MRQLLQTNTVLPSADLELVQAVDQATIHGTQVFATGHAIALDMLGDIILPPGAEVQVDQAQLRALAALYLAANLEPAAVISSVEMLTQLIASGGMQYDFGDATVLLHSFWKARHERISPNERAAFFAHLFGSTSGPPLATSDRNFDFEMRMVELCEALYRLDESAYKQSYSGIRYQSQVRATARSMLINLVDVSGGITAFLAEEVLKTLKDALAILTRPELRAAFQSRDIWSVIAFIARLAQTSHVTPRLFVRRGRAGMTIIAWLSEIAPLLGSETANIIEVSPAAVAAAIDWMETSLSIGEANMPTASLTPATPGSPWATVGA